MADRFLGLRCRPGDLAVIVQDEPECQGNIGQLVRVVKESDDFPDELGFHWAIQPLSSEPSPILICNLQNGPRKVVYDTGPRAHLDAWLRPLLNDDEHDEADQLEEVKPTEKALTEMV
jgi:hypothetical protein